MTGEVEVRTVIRRGPIVAVAVAVAAVLVALVAGAVPGGAAGAPSRGPGFTVDEATISSIHHALRTNRATCEEIVSSYLERIAAYEDAGPAINAVIAVNPAALAEARAVDEELRRGKRHGHLAPLGCVPMLVKDNVDTADMPTTAGSRALEGFVPAQDATVAARLRAAGAIILAKSNLDEFARGSSGLSGLGGQTRNPYDPSRIPGGSSAGTGAGIAANLATVGIGTETGVSIRNPATNGSLVGIAPTRGLVSAAGIVPISFTQDRAGPIARTVDDAARVLEVIAGFDERDPQTALSYGRVAASYTSGTRRAVALRGARIGVARELFGGAPAEGESAAIVDAAIAELANQGAEVVQGVPLQAALDLRLPVLDPLYPNVDRTLVRALSDSRTNNFEQREAMNRYLASQGPNAPYANLTELIASGLVLPSLVAGFVESDRTGLDDPGYVERLLRMSALQSATLNVMAQLRLDAIVYPMKTQPAPPIGGRTEPGVIAASGNILSSITGFPAVVVPAGFTAAGLPVSIEFLGAPFTEDRLVGLAHDYEQAARQRRPPAATPPLG